LTEAFGDGNEPDTSWCVNHISFFEGEKEFTITDYAKKKILCIGDSNTSSNVCGWVNKIDGAVNGGFKGAFMAKGNDVMGYYSAPALIDAMFEKDFSQQVNNAGTAEFKNNADQLAKYAETDFEHVIIAYGTNDFSKGVELGVTNTLDEDTNTFCGALRYVLAKLLTEKPDIKIIVVTPGWRSTAEVDKVEVPVNIKTHENSKGYLLDDYVSAIKGICSAYGAVSIDFLYESGIWDANATSFLYDGLHGNDAYHEKLAEMVKAEMAAMEG
jgi:lysophospholipase L1-like esterase